MERQIKFRAWHINDKMMLPVDYLDFIDGQINYEL